MNKSSNTTAHDSGSQLFVAMQVLLLLRQGRRVSTNELKQELASRGIHRDRRSVQRILASLAKRFPIEGDGESPQGWRWRRDADPELMEVLRSAA